MPKHDRNVEIMNNLILLSCDHRLQYFITISMSHVCSFVLSPFLFNNYYIRHIHGKIVASMVEKKRCKCIH